MQSLALKNNKYSCFRKRHTDGGLPGCRFYPDYIDELLDDDEVPPEVEVVS